METTQLRLDRLNGFIESKELEDDLAEFGLEYPITVNDLIQNTEAVYELIHDRDMFTHSEYARIAR